MAEVIRKTTREEKAGQALALAGLLGLPALIGFMIIITSKRK